MLSFILSIFPIVLLIYLMVKKKRATFLCCLTLDCDISYGRSSFYTLIQILSLLVQMLFLQLLRYKLLLQ